jgi:aldose 1-epimerase
MPVVAGWHPCFRGQPSLGLPATAMWRRDSSGIPTGEVVPVPPGPWDDAFEVDGDPVLAWPDLTVTLRSTCSTWVVYDEDPRLVCVEPQTDAPDAFNRSPLVLEAGEALTLSLHLSWRT